MLKVIVVLVWDFLVCYALSREVLVAAVVTGILGLYVWLGGYLALLKDGAVLSKDLSSHERRQLEFARDQIIKDVNRVSGKKLSKLKVYMVPDHESMNATAYGANCVSVTTGTYINTDPVTMTAVLGHEVSHLLHRDPEFNRAVFASVAILMAVFSAASAVSMVLIFFLFLLLTRFRSWTGLFVFKGTTTVVGGMFQLIQRGIVALYSGILGLLSRRAEYRCDQYACKLGYGLQLSYFLMLAESGSQRQMTISEALYRSHPPTEKRIARLETQIEKQKRA